MLIKFQPDGHNFSVDFENDHFVKGDYGVHNIDIIVLDETFDKYNSMGFVQFKRNNDEQSSPYLPLVNKSYEVDGVIYNGFTFTMDSEWYCAVAGLLKMTIEIKTYSGVDKLKAYGIVEINVEDSVAEDIPTTITQEEYSAFQQVLLNKLDIQDEKVIKLESTHTDLIGFANDCLNKKNEKGLERIFVGLVEQIGEDYLTIGIVGADNSVLVISASGVIGKVKDDDIEFVETPRLNVDELITGYVDLKQNAIFNATKGVVLVPKPIDKEQVANKEYVDSLKTFRKYSTSSNGANMTESYNGEAYVGYYVGVKDTTDPSKYVWSRINKTNVEVSLDAEGYATFKESNFNAGEVDSDGYFTI